MVRRPPRIVTELRRWRAGTAPECGDVTTAAAHKLAPLFWLQDKTPMLRRYIMASTARWAEVAPAAREALAALSAITPVMPLRALDYATTLYPAREVRPFNDLDVLVLPSAFARAADCLFALGFRPIHDQRGVAGHSNHYAWQFVRDAVSIDLHRGIRQHVRAAVDYEALFARASPSERLGVSVVQADAVDRVLLHVAHQAGHEFAGPLIGFVDLELLLRGVDWTALHQRAAHYGLAHALHAALQLRLRLWGAPHVASPWPGAWPSLSRQASPSYRVPRALQIARKLTLLDGWKYRTAFARYALAALQPGRQRQ